MNAFYSLRNPGESPRIRYRGLAAILGVITLVTFGTERLLYETAGQSLGEVPAYVMAGVALAVGITSLYASIHDQSIITAITLAFGPVSGLLVYLIGYHLVLPPSSDSPTWLIFLAFAGGFLAIGIGTHFLGRITNHVS